MFGNLIVGVDGNDGALDALALARTLVAPDGAVTLVHVEVKGRDGPAAETAPPLVELPGGPDGAVLDLLVVQAPSAAAGLHAHAVRTGAEVIVIGASRRAWLRRAVGRDDTSAVLEEPPCAVAVAPVGYAGRPRAVRTVGVGYDGSAAGEDALAAARELATAHGARLSALEAVRPHVWTRDRWNPAEEIETRVDAARRRISALGEVEAHAEYGGAADALERYGADVDLLVIGAHDYGDGPDLAPASLAQRLAGRAPCPLFVLPMPRRAAQSPPG